MGWRRTTPFSGSETKDRDHARYRPADRLGPQRCPAGGVFRAALNEDRLTDKHPGLAKPQPAKTARSAGTISPSFLRSSSCKPWRSIRPGFRLGFPATGGSHAIQFTPHRPFRARRRVGSTPRGREPSVRPAHGRAAERDPQQLPFRFHVQLLRRHAGRRRGAAMPATQCRQALARLSGRRERARPAERAASGGRACSTSPGVCSSRSCCRSGSGRAR